MEGYGPSTYGDRFADVYDDWYAGVSDVGATVERVAALAGTGPVLELGGGSGRLAVPLSARGIETWTIDASAAMVERLRSKPGGERVHAVVGDMSELDLGDAPRFAVVLCAFNTFFNLTTTDAQRRCLARVAERLAQGGRLVVEAFVPPPDAGTGVKDSIELHRIGVDDVVLMVSRTDPAARTVISQHVQLSAAGLRMRPSVLHYTSPAGLDALAAEAGLRRVDRAGGWRGEPFDDASPTHVTTYASA